MEKRTTTVVLDRPREMRFDANAMTYYEEATGKSFLDQPFDNLSGTDLRAIAYGCLKTVDPSITLEETGRIIHVGNVKTLLDEIVTMMGIAKEKDPRSLAPYVSTPELVIERMIEMCEPKPGEKFYDLGCGDGRAVFIAAQKFHLEAIGIDLNTARIEACKVEARKRALVGRVRFVAGDLNDLDLRDANIIFLYLLTASNEKIRPLLEACLRKGARVVSHDFEMTSWQNGQVARIHDGKRNHLIWSYEIGKYQPTQ